MPPMLCFLLLLSCVSFGQVRDRIYLQTDRAGYAAGETVWFKGYLFSGLVPGSLGTNLYLELVNQAGDPVLSGRVPIFGGIGFGSFDLPLKLTQGVYQVRAFTKTSPSGEWVSSVVTPVFVFNPGMPGSSASEGSYTVNFIPSSGWLVGGLENSVFTTVHDKLGKPLAAEAELQNRAGEKILSFKTDDKGRGHFAFTPALNETYAAKITFPGGVSQSFRLPMAVSDKVIVSVSDAARSRIFKVAIPESQRTGGIMTISGFMDDNLVFEKKFTASTDQVSARIPVDELPAGILQLIVRNTAKENMGQAVTWIASDSSFLPVQLVADTVNTTPRGRNVFSLIVPENILGSFSVSVTDADKTFYAPRNNIISGLLLNQDSRDHAFIDNTHPDQPADLQMAMGVTRWLDQSQFTGGNSVVADSQYITIRGQVRNKDNKKPVTKGDLSVRFTNKDSITSYVGAALDSEGKFALPKLVFEGNQKFIYSLNGNRWTDLEMVIDSTEETAFPPVQPFIVDRTAFINHATSQQMTEMITTLTADSISSTGLKEVVVRSRQVSPTKQVNDRYTRGLFTSMVSAKVLDLINDPPPPGGNILDYLQGRMSGLMIYSSGGQYVIQTNRMLSLTMMPPFRLFLNEMETSITFLSAILAKDVALVKYYPPGTGSFPGIGIAPVLAVYTKKASDGGSTDLLASGSFTYKGYFPLKDFTNDFLVPKENIAAKRNTIFWEPNLLPEENKPMYKIRFNNSDVARRFHVVIEGFTIDGKLVHYEKVIE